MWFLAKSWTTPKGRVLTPDDADELLETLTGLTARMEHVEAALGYSVDERGDVVVKATHLPSIHEIPAPAHPGYIDHSN